MVRNRRTRKQRGGLFGFDTTPLVTDFAKYKPETTLFRYKNLKYPFIAQLLNNNMNDVQIAKGLETVLTSSCDCSIVKTTGVPHEIPLLLYALHKGYIETVKVLLNFHYGNVYKGRKDYYNDLKIPNMLSDNWAVYGNFFNIIENNKNKQDLIYPFGEYTIKYPKLLEDIIAAAKIIELRNQTYNSNRHRAYTLNDDLMMQTSLLIIEQIKGAGAAWENLNNPKIVELGNRHRNTWGGARTRRKQRGGGGTLTRGIGSRNLLYTPTPPKRPPPPKSYSPPPQSYNPQPQRLSDEAYYNRHCIDNYDDDDDDDDDAVTECRELHQKILEKQSIQMRQARRDMETLPEKFEKAKAYLSDNCLDSNGRLQIRTNECYEAYNTFLTLRDRFTLTL